MASQICVTHGWSPERRFHSKHLSSNLTFISCSKFWKKLRDQSLKFQPSDAVLLLRVNIDSVHFEGSIVSVHKQPQFEKSDPEHCWTTASLSGVYWPCSPGGPSALRSDRPGSHQGVQNHLTLFQSLGRYKEKIMKSIPTSSEANFAIFKPNVRGGGRMFRGGWQREGGK